MFTTKVKEKTNAEYNNHTLNMNFRPNIQNIIVFLHRN